jgi:hypothetical protein
MPTDSSHKPSFSPARRWAVALNVLASCASLAALVLMANYLASRHFKRYQWMADERYRLSPMTVKMLEAITNQVKVIVFFNPDHALFSSVKGLIKEYRLACPRLEVEFVDYIHSPGRAALIKTQYKIASPTDENFIIFESNNKPPRFVYEKELSDYDYSGMLAGGEVKRVAFKGEQFFTSAIVGVTDPKAFKAYFLQGHGEHRPDSEDDTMGYFKFARVLQEKNIAVEPLSLVTNAVPTDCQLLIIAGPRHTLSGPELERLDDYLNRGGRAFVLLANPQISGLEQTGLERVLANWGVEVGDRLVSDEAQAKAGHESILFVDNFGQHTIVRPLVGSRLGMVLPHAVRPLPGAGRTADAAKVVELASTSQAGREAGGARGVIPLAVAVEKGAIPGVGADRGSTRMVVVGDSYFLTNANIEFDANRDFANLAANWLLDRTQLLAIGPRPIREFKISLTQSQMTAARWILLAGMPGGVLLLGLLVWLRRRS